jgi:hypothetical protein
MMKRVEPASKIYFPGQTGARDLCVCAVDDEQNSETLYHGV